MVCGVGEHSWQRYLAGAKALRPKKLVMYKDMKEGGLN